MNAHLYLIPESFSQNNKYGLDQIEAKAKLLAQDVLNIRRFKETNTLYVNFNELFSISFYSTFTIEDFICGKKELKEFGIDRDVIASIQTIFDRISETSISSEEILGELINWCDEDNCHGVIAFDKIDQLTEFHQVIYGYDSWCAFRRHFLSLYPKNSDFFIDECIKYFPNLYFHERNKSTINTIIDDCPKKIVYHLSALNDKFHLSQSAYNLNRTQVLLHFSQSCKLDETATLQGSAHKKNDLTFEFLNDSGELEKVCCEPHLKLCYNDGHPGDKSYSNDRRIYFHEGKSHIQKGKILIGHIGRHL